MSDVVINVEGVGKRYKLHHQNSAGGSLREAIYSTLTSPLRILKHKRNTTEDFWPINDITFKVKEGEVVGLLGRNGAGKSTLLKIVSRITVPTTGKIEMWGRVGSLLEVGSGFHPELSGRENIFLNGAMLGMTSAEVTRKFDEIVAFAEIERFIDMAAKHYSSGMYMKLAFAVASSLETEILIVAEVLAVGDEHFQRKCLARMREVAKSGRTVIFVSHNMGAIAKLCSRGLLLRGGRLALDTSTEEAIAEYMKGTADSGTPGVALFKPTPTDGYVTRVALENDKGENTTTLDVQKPYSFVIDYTVLENRPDMELTLSIVSSSGFRLMDCHRSQNMQDGTDIGKPGHYRSRVHIPAMLLAPGIYSVKLSLYQPNIISHDQRDDVFNFTVIETGSWHARYQATFPGSILTTFPWETSPVSESPNHERVTADSDAA
ncbi:ABC transporter ATP-binding protein [soil metagenome]